MIFLIDDFYRKLEVLMKRSIGRKVGKITKEALNKYRHSQIFRILNGSWESFDDFQPLSPSPGLEIGLYGF